MRVAHSILALAVGLSLSSVPPFATAAGQTELVEELRTLVDKSRRERAADRWLQNALEDLLAKHDNPWQREILYDDFADGDYTRQPSWQVLRGEFQVIRGQGLFSSADAYSTPSRSSGTGEKQPSASEALSGLIVGAILDSALGPADKGQTGNPPANASASGGPAEIRLKANVSNSFAIDMGFRHAAGRDAAFEVVLQQSEAGNYGYRLRVQSGRRGFIEVQRIRAGRGSVVASKNLDPGYADGRLHELTWRQGPDGTIGVAVDGVELLSARDRAYRDPYPWLHLVNDQGEMTLRSLRVSGL